MNIDRGILSGFLLPVNNDIYIKSIREKITFVICSVNFTKDRGLEKLSFLHIATYIADIFSFNSAHCYMWVKTRFGKNPQGFSNQEQNYERKKPRGFMGIKHEVAHVL